MSTMADLGGLPSDCVGRLDVPVWDVRRRPAQGQPMLTSNAGIDGRPVIITVTTCEIHILAPGGRAFAVDLQAFCQRAFDVVEGYLTGEGRR